MNLLSLPPPEALAAYDVIMRAATAAGVITFGGNCAGAAIAINDVLFAGRGQYVAALNKAFLQHNTCVGHVALRLQIDGNECYLDGDGRPKSADELLSWGMLEIADPDWAAHARALGFPFTERAATSALLHVYPGTDDLMTDFPCPTLPAIIQGIEAAARALQTFAAAA